MEPENIDWNNIESVFEEDETYEKIIAPKWVDLSAPDEVADDESWFCNSDCKHPKTAEDFVKSKRNSKMKHLRSVTMADILPFMDRNHRDAKNASSAAEFPNPKLLQTESSSFSSNANEEDIENKDPNFSIPTLQSEKPRTKKYFLKPQITEKTSKKKQVVDEPAEKYPPKQSAKPRLKSTLSMRNLISGREILNQISDLCTEMKKLATKRSKKGMSEKLPGGRQRERMPLIDREGKV